MPIVVRPGKLFLSPLFCFGRWLFCFGRLLSISSYGLNLDWIKISHFFMLGIGMK